MGIRIILGWVFGKIEQWKAPGKKPQVLLKCKLF